MQTKQLKTYGTALGSYEADIAGNMNNAPVLIRITDPLVIDAVQPEVPDLSFVYDDDSTRLSYETERWDQAKDLYIQ